MTTAARRTSLPTASNKGGEIQAWPERPESITKAVEACQRGDPDAQRRLFESSNQNVYGLMVRMVGFQDAADLTQQVFLQVFRQIGQFTGRAQIGTWIYRVAVNEALQHLRRLKRSRVRTLTHEPIDLSYDSFANVDDKELLEQALGRLETDLRSVFLLREIEGLTYCEIAEVLGIPEGTVGSRLNRARRKLKEHIIELGWEPKRELLGTPATPVCLSRRRDTSSVKQPYSADSPSLTWCAIV